MVDVVGSVVVVDVVVVTSVHDPETTHSPRLLQVIVTSPFRGP